VDVTNSTSTEEFPKVSPCFERRANYGERCKQVACLVTTLVDV